MSKPLSPQINIFISVDQQNIHEYFNPHDSAPLYKRQLSQAFELYIMNSIVAAKRYSPFTYKIYNKSEEDQQFMEPLLYAIRRHFSEKKAIREAEFEKFKRRSYLLLFYSLAVVMICQGLIPLIFKGRHPLNSGVNNTLEVFSWVVLWRPIEQLLFFWNPYLKDISIMGKLAAGTVMLVDNA